MNIYKYYVEYFFKIFDVNCLYSSYLYKLHKDVYKRQEEEDRRKGDGRRWTGTRDRNSKMSLTSSLGVNVL